MYVSPDEERWFKRLHLIPVDEFFGASLTELGPLGLRHYKEHDLGDEVKMTHKRSWYLDKYACGYEYNSFLFDKNVWGDGDRTASWRFL